MAFESTSNAGDRQNVQNLITYCSLISATSNPLALRVELRPQGNLDPLAEMVTLMQEQATRIQELKQNMEHMWNAEKRQRH